MLNYIFKDKSTKTFAIIAVVLFTAILIIEKINGRFWLNDFKVFYSAAEALLNDEQVYGKAFGLSTGFYKYSPFTLIFFTPFTLFSYEIASIIHFLIIGLCTIFTIIQLEQIIGKYLFEYGKKSYLTFVSIFLCVVLHLVRELHLGNINMILLALLGLSLKFSLESKPIRSGLLLAIAIITKPYFIICVLPFLLHRRYKEVITVTASGILFVLLSAIAIGFSASITLYLDWFAAMMDHSSYLTSNHTVFALLNKYTGLSIQPTYALPFLGVIGAISCLYFWKAGNTSDKSTSFVSTSESLLIHYYFLIAIIPNILITDTEHFLFSLPLIAVLVLYLSKIKHRLWTVLFILLIFLYEGNSSDLIGKNLAGKFENFGILGISNLIIIGIVIFVYSKKKMSGKWGII